MNEEARPAVVDDVAAITELHRAATAELRAERGGDLWARQSGRDVGPVLDLDDPAAAAWVGTIDGTVVGYALIHAEVLPSGGDLAVLTDVYVEAGARGVGVGEALLDAAVAWATSRGCVAIDSIALPGMRASKNFFETAGMVARAITVSKRLG